MTESAVDFGGLFFKRAVTDRDTRMMSGKELMQKIRLFSVICVLGLGLLAACYAWPEYDNEAGGLTESAVVNLTKQGAAAPKRVL